MMQPKKWDYFFIGIGTFASANGLYQDFLGLEGYISYLRGHWIEPGWTTWFSAVMLVVFVVAMFRKDK